MRYIFETLQVWIEHKHYNFWNKKKNVFFCVELRIQFIWEFPLACYDLWNLLRL